MSSERSNFSFYFSANSQNVLKLNLTAAQMQEISEAFTLFDSDKDNRLSPYEFKVRKYC